MTVDIRSSCADLDCPFEGRPARHTTDVTVPDILAVWVVAIGMSDYVPGEGGFSGTSDFSGVRYSRGVAHGFLSTSASATVPEPVRRTCPVVRVGDG